jgi:hypothetical protein
VLRFGAKKSIAAVLQCRDIRRSDGYREHEACDNAALLTKATVSVRKEFGVVQGTLDRRSDLSKLDLHQGELQHG